jgi:hypothetical protein
MELLEPALAGLLVATTVAFVARPFLRDPRPATDAGRGGSDADRARPDLLEDLDRAIAAVKELDFDYRAGKLAEAEYREMRGRLRHEAAAAFARLESEPLAGRRVRTARRSREPARDDTRARQRGKRLRRSI